MKRAVPGPPSPVAFVAFSILALLRLACPVRGALNISVFSTQGDTLYKVGRSALWSRLKQKRSVGSGALDIWFWAWIQASQAAASHCSISKTKKFWKWAFVCSMIRCILKRSRAWPPFVAASVRRGVISTERRIDSSIASSALRNTVSFLMTLTKNIFIRSRGISSPSIFASTVWTACLRIGNGAWCSILCASAVATFRMAKVPKINRAMTEKSLLQSVRMKKKLQQVSSEP